MLYSIETQQNTTTQGAPFLAWLGALWRGKWKQALTWHQWVGIRLPTGEKNVEDSKSNSKQLWRQLLTHGTVYVWVKLFFEFQSSKKRLSLADFNLFLFEQLNFCHCRVHNLVEKTILLAECATDRQGCPGWVLWSHTLRISFIWRGVCEILAASGIRSHLRVWGLCSRKLEVGLLNCNWVLQSPVSKQDQKKRYEKPSTVYLQYKSWMKALECRSI